MEKIGKLRDFVFAVNFVIVTTWGAQRPKLYKSEKFSSVICEIFHWALVIRRACVMCRGGQRALAEGVMWPRGVHRDAEEAEPESHLEGSLQFSQVE